MADNRLTDQQVTDLVTLTRSEASLDAKVQYVTAVKSGIKQHNVPDTCILHLFDGLRTAAASQHASLVNAGFTALNHLLTRLSRQEPKYLAKEAARTLPLLVEKLGDPKDKFRALAAQALTTLYPSAPVDVERFVRNSAMGGKNSRAKEAALHWLLMMHDEHGMQFRGYVPTLMELLEDADGSVRDTTKVTVIELFKNAPDAAKSDLKRQLKNFKVRPGIEQAIVKALIPVSGRSETPSDMPTQPPSSRPNLSASVPSLPVERPVTPAVSEVKVEAVEPMYVNTNRELEDIFRDMTSCFDGRESEQNWLKRETSANTIRRLLAGNAPSDYHDAFVGDVRALLDGIIKCVNSLRTSLSKEGCSLVQDLATTFGPGMDPMVELLMQTLLKLSAGTKKISSQQANATVDIILGQVSYTPRIMQHMWMAFQDKNVQPRTYANGWLQTIIKKEAGHKHHIEHGGGVDLIEKCLKKGLADPNPAVREKTRSTFWVFWGLWPAKADAIMADLDATAQKLLNKDPHNPNASSKGDASVRPGLGLSKSTMGSSTTTSKPSLRETLRAQKKATMTGKTLPPRPGSAMSQFSSPSRTQAPATTTSTVPIKPSASAARGRQEASISVNAGGMSVAPMRPNRRRPEMAPRPATAGPYSVRDQAPESPDRARSKTPRPRETTPKRAAAPRQRSGHASHASESSIPSPTARSTARSLASPRMSPARFRHSQTAGVPGSSPVTAEEEFSLVVPNLSSLKSPPVLEPEPLPVASIEHVHEPTAHYTPRGETVPAAPVDIQHEFRRELSVPDIKTESVEKNYPVKVEAVSPVTPQPGLKVYEDPNTGDQTTSKPTVTTPVLEDRSVNEDAATLPRPNEQGGATADRAQQNARLLDSGIARVKAKSLDVHGFRKLQSLLRESKGFLTDEKLEALLLGLFYYLEDPLPNLMPEKGQDVKAQILATIKLMLKKERDNFQPHVSKGLESLLQTRASYENRAHIVSGLELLADELVTIGDGAEIVVVLTRRLQNYTDESPESCRTLSMGLHVLRSMFEKRPNFVPTASELGQLATLTARCLDAADSGVRMDAVQLCVALHARIGEAAFWDALRGVQEDPKSLITYYIVKRQREQGVAPAAA